MAGSPVAAMNTTEHTWLDLVPPRGATPTELGPDSRPGDAITITAEESRRLNAIDGIHWTHLPMRPDDTRQYACRILGPRRVAVILQNHERGLRTPVVVE
jgi:hypothetical protein